MTPEQLSILKSEIQSDPIRLGYSACFPASPGHAVELINLPMQTMIKPITAAVAMTWAASGPYAAIVDAANTANHPFRASCLVIRETFAAGLDIDLQHPEIQAMFAGWLAATLITQDQHDALMTVATQPASRAEVLGLDYVTESDIRLALES